MKISDKDDGFYIYKQEICLLRRSRSMYYSYIIFGALRSKTRYIQNIGSFEGLD